MLSALLLQVMCQPPASPIMPQLSPRHQLCLPVPLSMCKLSTGVAYYPVRFPLFPAKKSQKQIQIQIKIHIRVLIHLSMCKYINCRGLLSCLLSSLSCKEFTKTKTNSNTNMSTDTFPLPYVMLKQNSKWSFWQKSYISWRDTPRDSECHNLPFYRSTCRILISLLQLVSLFETEI